MEILSTSVGELWRQVLPPGSDLLAGERGLSREVAWASTLRVRPPAFPKLGPGDMALLVSDWLELMDPPLSLAQALEGLAQRGAAAVAVVGQIPEDAIQRAEALGMPLLQLPEGTNPYELEGSIARFISHQRTMLHQRGAEIHHRLMEASIQGRGMPGLLQVLAQVTGKAAAFLDQRHRPSHLAAPPGMKVTLEGLTAALAEAGPSELQTSPQVTEGPEPSVLDLPIALAGFQAIGCTVALEAQVAGFLLLVGAAGQMGPLERLALAQASSVFTAEMARERAVAEAESRLKGDFLEELLEGELADEEEMVSRARYLGYDLSGPGVVVVLTVQAPRRSSPGMGEGSEALMGRLSEVLPKGIAAMARGRGVVLVMPLADAQERAEPAARAENLRVQVAQALGRAVVAGVGRCYPGPSGLRRSYQEARRALALGVDMAPGGRTHFFGSLGIYPVLFPLRDTQEAEAFLEEALGPLTTYDQRHKSELLRTLDTYLSNQGDLGRTAGALHLHRNSLAYRLRRIQEVAGISLDNAEDCFRLQLALKLRRLLKP